MRNKDTFFLINEYVIIRQVSKVSCYLYQAFNPFPHKANLQHTTSKTFGKIYIKTINEDNKVEKRVAKGGFSHYEHCFLLPQCF